MAVQRSVQGQSIFGTKHLVDWLQHLEPSVSGGNNFIGISPPHEGFRCDSVVFGDEPVDRRLEVNKGMKDAVFQSAAGQFCKEPLNRIQP